MDIGLITAAGGLNGVDPALLAFAAAALLAGIVRGFSGFGTAMAFMPVASAATHPAFALIALQVMDIGPALPMAVRNWRHSAPREIVPLAASAAATVPVGVAILKSTDPVTIRWCVAAIILALVAVLASGWRYRQAPSLPVTIGTGGIAGLFGGLAGLAGPPVILFWLSGQDDAGRVRANMMVFLGLMTVFSCVTLALAGLFTLKAAIWGVMMVPVYGLGLVIGTRFFPLASDALFRRLALGFIVLAVLVSLPLFDGLFQ